MEKVLLLFKSTEENRFCEILPQIETHINRNIFTKAIKIYLKITSLK